MGDIEQGRLVCILLMGLIIGYTMHCFTMQEYAVVYISQNELMTLENKRMQALPLDKQQLFVGKPEIALSLIQEIANRYDSSEIKVVFTDSKASGRNVHSITKEVHDMLLEELSQ